MGYNGEDFYGDRADVFLVGFLRPEKKFGGIDELKAQIGEDAKVRQSICNALMCDERNKSGKSKCL